MTTTHTPMNWFAGDDWEIVATLLDENGDPYNLGSQTILWALMDNNYQRVIDENDVNVAILDAAAGKCSIVVPAVKTSALGGGQYSDIIRIIDGSVTSTLSTGMIYVVADPWAAALAGTRADRPALRRVS